MLGGALIISRLFPPAFRYHVASFVERPLFVFVDAQAEEADAGLDHHYHHHNMARAPLLFAFIAYCCRSGSSGTSSSASSSRMEEQIAPMMVFFARHARIDGNRPWLGQPPLAFVATLPGAPPPCSLAVMGALIDALGADVAHPATSARFIDHALRAQRADWLGFFALRGGRCPDAATAARLFRERPIASIATARALLALGAVPALHGAVMRAHHRAVPLQLSGALRLVYVQGVAHVVRFLLLLGQRVDPLARNRAGQTALEVWRDTFAACHLPSRLGAGQGTAPIGDTSLVHDLLERAEARRRMGLFLCAPRVRAMLDADARAHVWAMLAPRPTRLEARAAELDALLAREDLEVSSVVRAAFLDGRIPLCAARVRRAHFVQHAPCYHELLLGRPDASCYVHESLVKLLTSACPNEARALFARPLAHADPRTWQAVHDALLAANPQICYLYHAIMPREAEDDTL